MVGIDSYAGPSELMVIAGHDADPEWIALDLCAQAEHGDESPLLVAAVEEHVLDAIERGRPRPPRSRGRASATRRSRWSWSPTPRRAIDLANAFAPEHLELIEEDAALLADRVTTAGCVFVGRYGATAFGDYAAGSNHVLPTAAPGASRARSARESSGARSHGRDSAPTRRRSWPRTSTRSPAPRAFPSTASPR